MKFRDFTIFMSAVFVGGCVLAAAGHGFGIFMMIAAFAIMLWAAAI